MDLAQELKDKLGLIADLLKENDRRNEIIYAKFDPITGEGSVGERVRVEIPDFIIPVQWLPVPIFSRGGALYSHPKLHHLR